MSAKPKKQPAGSPWQNRLNQTHLALEVGLGRELLVHDPDVVLQAVLLGPPLPAEVAD